MVLCGLLAPEGGFATQTRASARGAAGNAGFFSGFLGKQEGRCAYAPLVTAPSGGPELLLKTLNVGRIHTNCYVLACERTREALVIDPGDDLMLIQDALAAFDARLTLIALTHYHFDHVLAAEALRQATGAPVAIGSAELDLLAAPPALFRFFREGRQSLTADRGLRDKEVLQVGDLRVTVLATPGHSPGGVSFWLPDERVVFCGDALFRGGVGRTDLPGSDAALLLRSIRERLFDLPDDTVVYPGHGPSTSIGHERRTNPWAASIPSQR